MLDFPRSGHMQFYMKTCLKYQNLMVKKTTPPSLYKTFLILHEKMLKYQSLMVKKNKIQCSDVFKELTTERKKKNCRDPGSNRGPSDLQSDALPSELSRHADTYLWIIVPFELDLHVYMLIKGKTPLVAISLFSEKSLSKFIALLWV